MTAKQATIAATHAKVEAMSDVTIAACYLKAERHWGSVTYWLVFTEEDVRARLQFDKIQDVWDWLVAFEQQHPPKKP